MVILVMIFVTLGTQDKPFARLIEAVEKQVKLGNIKEEVIVQAGCTKYKTEEERIKIVDYMEMKEFNKKVEAARIIITHAGVGTIIQALEENKKIIAAARKKEYGEHVNNHQEQILENFENKGYIIALKNFEELDKALKKAENFEPKKFTSNYKYFVEKIEEKIEELLKK